MELINGLGMILTVLSLAVAVIIAPIAWFRCAVNLMRMSAHVKKEVSVNHPSLRWNPANALFIPSALDAVGLEARKQVLKNSVIFVVLIAVTMLLATLTGLAS